MSKILPDGFVNTDILSDFSVFNLNNSIIGQYAGKVIQGNNNLIIGNNACKLGIDINHSIFLGNEAAKEINKANQVIIIGDNNATNKKLKEVVDIGFGNTLINDSNIVKITNDRNILSLNEIGFFNEGIANISIGNYNSNLKSSINIGNSNISTIDNSIIIGNSIINDKFTLNIDNVLCYDNNNIIYLACGAYKDFPIILGSKNDFNNLTNNENLSFDKNFITSVFKVKNSNNNSITFKTNANINLIYKFPELPNYDYSYLSTDTNGNLFWLNIQENMIETINTTGNIICNNLEAINIRGDGKFIDNVTMNLGDKTTDNLKEGVTNFYNTIGYISQIFYVYLQSITTDDINNSKNTIANYFSFTNYSNNFNLNLQTISTDDIIITERSITGIRFYSLEDYDKIANEYLQITNTDDLVQGKNNLYYDERKINIDIDKIKEGSSNFYFNSNNYNNLITSNLNNRSSDNFKQGNINLYYNNDTTISNINNSFGNITTDDVISGNSNKFLNYANMVEYISQNYPNTDIIKEGSNNNYFSNINNSNKYQLNTDNIRQGTSNLYFTNSRDIINIISSITTTDLYKEGNKNLYYYEDRGISNFKSNIPIKVNTDTITQGSKNKFIENNFYNDDLQIKGFLKTNAVNIINNPNVNFLNGLEKSNLIPTIGPNTEVLNIFDYNKLVLNSPLSNIEISYCNANPTNTPKVPFIIINDNVGINMTNPQYNLDVNGIIKSTSIITSNITTSNLNIIDNFTRSYLVDQMSIINNGTSIPLKVYQLSTKENVMECYNPGSPTFIITSNSNIGINNLNPNINYKLDINGPLQTSAIFLNNINISNIFVTSNILSNTSNTLANYNNLYNIPQFSNIFVTSNNLSNTSNTLANYNNLYNIPQFSNIFVTSNILSNTSNTLANYNNLYNIPDIYTKTEIDNNFITLTQCNLLYLNIYNDLNIINTNNKWIINDSNLYTLDYNIGIGKTNPNYKVDIVGTLQSTDFRYNDKQLFSLLPTDSPIFNSGISTQISPTEYYVSYTQNDTMITNNVYTCDILVVGAGGRGGFGDYSGGGGAGEVIYIPNYTLAQGVYNIQVGIDSDNIINRISKLSYQTTTDLITAKGGGDGGYWNNSIETTAKRFPPKVYDSTPAPVTISSTLNSRSCLKATITITNSSYGSGNYEVFYSSRYATTGYEAYELFNYTSASSGSEAAFLDNQYSTTSPFTYTQTNYLVDNAYKGDWVCIKLSIPIIITSYSFYQRTSYPNRVPKNFKLYASNNGTNWTTIQTITNATYASNSYTSTVTGVTTPYLYYAIVVNAILGADSILNFNEWVINGKQVKLTSPSSGGSGGGGNGNSLFPQLIQSGASAGTSFNSIYSKLNNGANGTTTKGGNGGSALITGRYTDPISGIQVGAGGSGAAVSSMPNTKINYGDGGDGNNGLGRQGIIIFKFTGDVITKFLEYADYNKLFNKPNLISKEETSNIFVTSNILSNTSNNIYKNISNFWDNSNSNIYYNLGNVGIGTIVPAEKLHIIGNIVASGTITGSFSDIRLKNKISNIIDPFKIINNLDTFYYTPNDLAKSYGFISNKRDIGLNALEVKELLPEVVSLAPFDMNENRESKSGENYLTISYERFVPLLIEGMKEMKKEIEDLKRRLSVE